MHIHTRDLLRSSGVRSSVLSLATFGVLAGGVAIAAPAAIATDAAPAAIATDAAPAAIAANAAPIVAARPTRVLLSADRLRSHPGEVVKLAGRVSIGGTASAVTAQRVTLQVLSGSAWLYVGKVTLGADGYSRFTVKPKATTTYRLAFNAAAGYAASLSTNVVVTVRADTSAERAARALAVARSKTGRWYRWGAAGPNNFDCSGLTQYAYRAIGVLLPHNANAQKSYGRRISRSQARPGDLIIFLRGSHGYHAAIYAGGGYMYDAPHSGAQVGRHKIWSSNIMFRRLV